MSREVRRVPLDWQHPTEPNPYWREQMAGRLRRGGKPQTLHAPEVRFVGLMDDYPGTLADWQQRGANLNGRTGRDWEFEVEYHLTGWRSNDVRRATIEPFYVRDGDNETAITVRDEDHLHELVTARHATEAPVPSRYMPVFAGPAHDLGWCLYETVSEGTPVTPVFATADELIDHLATVGTEWGGPLRRESAEQIVRTGFTFGSMVVVGGRVLNSTNDADIIAGIGGAA